VFKDKPEVFCINDSVYKAFEGAYLLGPMKFVHSVKTIYEALNIYSPSQILSNIQKYQNIEDFWESVGSATARSEVDKIDFSGDIDMDGVIKKLQKEMKIRMGTIGGVPTPAMNKYFKKNGQLNARGIRIVSGEL
jgi:hypothetical protein